jgi:FkbM family methyltransferase
LTNQIQSEINELLSEPVEAAKRREAVTFEDRAGSRPIVLFGAGGLGRRTLQGLRARGIETIAFCDNNRALWGKTVDQVPVYSLTDAANRFGRTAAFIVTVWGGRPIDRMVDRISQVRAAGCETVLHFGELYWRYPEMFPHYAADSAHRVLENKEAVLACANLWADEASQLEYLAQVRWRLHFDFAGLPDPVDGPMYFRQIENDEVFVDCGAFDGDTVRSFLRHTGGQFKRIYALEPDPANFQKLTSIPGIAAKQAAVGRTNGMVPFSAGGGESSSAGKGDSQVECVSLDQYLGGETPTLIKMDIEGFEPEALAGARQIIARDSPQLAISVYHAQEHLWEIPIQIQSYNPNYRFYLRPHVYDVWDLVCYAVPHQAVRPPSTDNTAPVI